MELSAHTINASSGTRKSSKRVGRGNASGKGTYASRGLKGQRARSGGKGGTQRRGFKASLQKVPKLRGFNSLNAKPETVTLATLSRICKDGDAVTPNFLANKGVIDKPQHGVKILGTGSLDKKITVKNCLLTKTALAAVEKAGGNVIF